MQRVFGLTLYRVYRHGLGDVERAAYWVVNSKMVDREP
jgi:hypothetical protein